MSMAEISMTELSVTKISSQVISAHEIYASHFANYVENKKKGHKILVLLKGISSGGASMLLLIQA